MIIYSEAQKVYFDITDKLAKYPGKYIYPG